MSAFVNHVESKPSVNIHREIAASGEVISLQSKTSDLKCLSAYLDAYIELISSHSNQEV